MNVIEFNSDRKRMSVIVRYPDGTIKLICKGADTIIKERILPTEKNNILMAHTDKFLIKYAEEGLRTLLLGTKILSEEEYG